MPGSESGNTFICPQWVESVILYSCNRCRRGHVNRIYATKLQMRMLTSTIIAQWSGKPKLLAQNTSKTFRLSHSDYHKGLTNEPYVITTSVGALLEYSDCLSYSKGQMFNNMCMQKCTPNDLSLFLIFDCLSLFKEVIKETRGYR